MVAAIDSEAKAGQGLIKARSPRAATALWRRRRLQIKNRRNPTAPTGRSEAQTMKAFRSRRQVMEIDGRSLG